MLDDFHLTITRMAAWAPGLVTRNDWKSWAAAGSELDYSSDQTPDLSFLPSMVRRRCKPHSRIVLHLAYRCLTLPEFSSTPLILASRYGDSELTLSLLKDLSQGTALSPTQFGLSVHNASLGTLSQLVLSHAPASAMAAGPFTFEHGLLEALSQLGQADSGPDAKVLLLIVESSLPQLFYQASDKMHECFGMGLVLQRTGAGVELSLEATRTESKEETRAGGQAGSRFLRWLALEESEPFRLTPALPLKLIRHQSKLIDDIFQDRVLEDA